MKLHETRYLEQIFHGRIYHAAATSHSKGVIIGILFSTLWILINKVLDQEGNNIILKRRLNLVKVALLGTEAPNSGTKYSHSLLTVAWPLKHAPRPVL